MQSCRLTAPARVLLPWPPIRGAARRGAALPRLHHRASFERYRQVIDLSASETAAAPEYLEGTGALVLDRVHRVAYVLLSERSHLAMAERWAAQLQYKVGAPSVPALGSPGQRG